MITRFGGYTLTHTGGSVSNVFGFCITLALTNANDYYYAQTVFSFNDNNLYFRNKVIYASDTMDWTGVVFKKVTSV